MSTTQRSESMNAFFDGSVHSGTNLKKFVDQFDNALRKKTEDENFADFSFFNATIPCISYFDIEKKFQELYTNAKFKEVQQEVLGIMYCNCSLLKIEGAISTYQVSAQLTVDDYVKIIIFRVYFNDDECEVKCSCGLFDVREILCRHALAVIITVKNVKLLPTRYFLDRWRKDLKRIYILIKSSYDDFSGNPDSRRYDVAVKSFSELKTIISTSEDHFNDVMHHLGILKEKYRGLNCQPRPPMLNDITDLPADKGGKVLSPLFVRGKGRPPSKRKISMIEKIVNRPRARNKQPSDKTNVIKKTKTQDI